MRYAILSLKNQRLLGAKDKSTTLVNMEKKKRESDIDDGR